jgi:hypothetical protein
MKKRNQKQQSNVTTQPAERPREMRFRNRLTGTRLEIPAGQPDIEGLRSVTREWLVPRLVEKFLRTHGIEFRHSKNSSAQLPKTRSQH